MESFFHVGSDTSMNYADVEREYQGELTSFLHNQRGELEAFSSFTPESAINPPGDHGITLEVAGSAYPVQDSFLPTPSDAITADSPRTSEESSPVTNSLVPKCEICQWKPDTSVKKSLKKLAAAVEKHVKRNHQSRDYQCSICHQSFRNRPDNVKPHIARKHPEMLEKLYPKTAQQDSGAQYEMERPSASPAARRRISMPLLSSQASPGRGNHVSFQRG